MSARKLVLVAAAAGLAAPAAMVILRLHASEAESPSSCTLALRRCNGGRVCTSLRNLNHADSQAARAICAAWLVAQPIDPVVKTHARETLAAWQGHVMPLYTGNAKNDLELGQLSAWRDATCLHAERCGLAPPVGPRPGVVVSAELEPWVLAIGFEADRCEHASMARCGTLW
jgi:hypothetical protein